MPIRVLLFPCVLGVLAVEEPVKCDRNIRNMTQDDELLKKLLSRAGAILARRAHSRGEIRVKLAKFADPDDVERTLDRLEAVNLLNDADYAYNFASSRIRQQGWGPLKVRQSLLRRHVAPLVTEEALDRLRQEIGDDVILGDYLKRFCQKSGLPRDRKGIQRLINHLRRRGFVDETIYGALRRAVPEAAWENFETGE